MDALNTSLAEDAAEEDSEDWAGFFRTLRTRFIQEVKEEERLSKRD